MTSYKEKIAALRKSRNFFPNSSTIGEFRPHSQTLHFNYLDHQLLKLDISKKRIGENRKHFEVLFHELTHWSDQVPTVWGQAYLASLFDAYHAMDAGDEALFFKIVTQFDEDRRILFPKYYHVVDAGVRPHSVTKRWRQELSSGLEFDPSGVSNPSRPIFFVRFGDHDDGSRIARQPLSVGSLLETTASWAEIRVAISAIGELDEQQKLVEIKIFENEKRNFIYNENLTLYTAPVHMLSNMAKTSDLIDAFRLSALLAHVSLIMTPELINRIAAPDGFGPFGERCEAFLRSCNRGYVFAALAAHSKGIDADQPIQAWLQTILERANLPKLEVLRHEAYQFMESLSRSLPVRGELDRERDRLLEIGRRRFLTNAMLVLDNFDPLGDLDGPLPQMFDCNGALFSMGRASETRAVISPEEMFDAEFRLFKFTDNLMQGCRGLTDIDLKQ